MTIIDSTFADKFVDAIKEKFGIIAIPEYLYDKTKDEYRIYEENNDINYTLLYSKEMDQVYMPLSKV